METINSIGDFVQRIRINFIGTIRILYTLGNWNKKVKSLTEVLNFLSRFKKCKGSVK